ncbi:hypothetical protein ACLB1G_04045 [Oxalobacteraceae bacterium A2-2]
MAGDYLAHQNLFWRAPDGSALIEKFSRDVTVSFGSAQRPTQADGYSAANDGLPFNLKPAGSTTTAPAQGFGLKSNGIYTANVAVRLAHLPDTLNFYRPFDTMDLLMRRHTSILVDHWAANGPAQLEDRLGGSVLIPSRVLGALAPVLGPGVTAAEGGHISGPRIGQLDAWRDVLPPDRLQ